MREPLKRVRRRSSPSTIGVFPRDPNPYQESLYRPLRRMGFKTRYLGQMTGSHSINLVLMPVELVLLRWRGCRLLHVHWTFGFLFSGVETAPGLRRLSRQFYEFYMSLARLLGIRIVWTMHNLLPHGRTFDDDERARRFLVSHSDLIICHSEHARRALISRFGCAPSAVVIPPGPSAPDGLGVIGPPLEAQGRRLLFLGLIEPYKGVEDLLGALQAPDLEIEVQIAGRCRDRALAARLTQLADGLPGVSLDLGYVEDGQVGPLLERASAVVLPYREVTTSGAASLAGVAGRAVLVPDLAGFRDLPDAAVIRHPPGVEGLRAALRRFQALDHADLLMMGDVHRRSLVSWESAAQVTAEHFRTLVGADDVVGQLDDRGSPTDEVIGQSDDGTPTPVPIDGKQQ